MTWWAWVLLWVVLVALAGLVLFVAARRVFRQGMALAAELGAAADTFAEVSLRLEQDPAGTPTAAASSPAGRAASTRASSRRPRRGARSQDVR